MILVSSKKTKNLKHLKVNVFLCTIACAALFSTEISLGIIHPMIPEQIGGKEGSLGPLSCRDFLFLKSHVSGTRSRHPVLHTELAIPQTVRSNSTDGSLNPQIVRSNHRLFALATDYPLNPPPAQSTDCSL